MADDEIMRRYAVAVEAAWQAAGLCSATYGAAQPVQTKGHLDVVTETDGTVERAIVARLRAAFPHDRIVGEEGDGDLADLRAPGFCWLLDPICGTDNFAHGLAALYCSNVALLLGGVVVMAAVAEGGRPDELLCAVRDGGAWTLRRDGSRRPLRVSAAGNLVAFDSGYLPSWGRPERAARIMNELMRRNRFGLRVLSSSLTLAAQARGALAGNVMEEVKPWDAAAGSLLLAEAGAEVSDLTGRPWSIDGLGLVSGSTPAVHAELLDAVAGVFRSQEAGR